MTSRARALSFAASLCLLPLLAFAADSPDPGIGTWKMNLAKSSLRPPIPKSEVRTYEAMADGSTKMTLAAEEADGKKDSEELIYKLDGKDYPVKDSQGYDSVTPTLVDKSTVTFTLKKAGKPVGSFKRTVSADGKTLTAVSKIAGEKSETAIYDKQ